MSCLEALVQPATGPGRARTDRELFATACEVFQAEGHLTMRTKGAKGVLLEEGFFHSLGRGVGLRLMSSHTCRCSGPSRSSPATCWHSSPASTVRASAVSGSRISSRRRGRPRVLTDFPYDLEP
jgi:hypothetical protein